MRSSLGHASPFRATKKRHKCSRRVKQSEARRFAREGEKAGYRPPGGLRSLPLASHTRYVLKVVRLFCLGFGRGAGRVDLKDAAAGQDHQAKIVIHVDFASI